MHPLRFEQGKCTTLDLDLEEVDLSQLQLHRARWWRRLFLGKYWEKCIGECGILGATWGPTEAKCLLRIRHLMREIRALLLTDERIPTVFFILHTFCVKIIVIKCPFTNFKRCNILFLQSLYLSRSLEQKSSFLILIDSPVHFSGNPTYL